MSQDPLAFRVLNEIGIIDQLAKTSLEAVLPDGLTLAQFIVLNYFVRLGGERSPSELARLFQVTKGTMTSTLQRLESKGFIDVFPDHEDGRGKRIRITDSGREAREASLVAVTPMLAAVETVVGGEMLASILPALSQLRAHLDAARDTPAEPQTGA